jgi:hypothetical protein
MDKDAKLAELEQRQRDIADEIEQLMKADDVHKPESGDVYTDGPDFFFVFGGDKVASLYLSPQFGNLHTHRVTAYQTTYLGKFNDVFITKKRVAEILTECRDSYGDSVLSGDTVCPSGIRAVREALAAEGITEVK